MLEKLAKKALREALGIKDGATTSDVDRPKTEQVKEVLSQVVADVELLAWKEAGRSAEVFARVVDTGSKAAPNTIISNAVANAYNQQIGRDSQRPPNGHVVSFLPDPKKPNAWYALVRLTG